MKTKIWLISWLITVVSILSIIGFWVYKIDPYFHYHKPDLDNYFYRLDNQRSQNDGIIKHFDYDAIVIGTSMTQNFRVTEVDKLFGCNSIKVPYSAASYKEINDNIKNALKVNGNLKIIIRCLDMGKFLDSADTMRYDLQEYPTYLYDRDPFNDVEYLLNRDVVFKRTYQMELDKNKDNFKPGITSFDDYTRWQSKYEFGINTVSPEGITVKEAEQIHLSEEEKKAIKQNIEINVTDTADENPDVDFYYYYSPYSVASWNSWKTTGKLYKMLEAEAYITELIVSHENIHLFSFNNRTDITTDLNNYRDETHYASWINSLILKWMHEGRYQLTEDNYKAILKKEYDFYTTFDYESVNDQEDYEADYYAGALLNNELTGVRPLDVLNDENVAIEIRGAELISVDNKNVILDCHGTLSRDSKAEGLADYLRDSDFNGIKFDVNLDDGYNYLCFNGQKITNQGSLTAYVYNKRGRVVGKTEVNYSNLDNEVHRYAVDLSAINGIVTVVLNGGYIDDTGSPHSNYQFSNIYMY